MKFINSIAKKMAIFDEKIEIRESFFASGFQNGAKECIV